MAIPRRLAYTFRHAICGWQCKILSVLAYVSVIATVAVYDLQLTVRYAACLKRYEQNPMGRWLMHLDRIGDNTMPDVTLFLVLKAVGTITVLVSVAGLVRWRSRLGHPVGLGVSSFQIGLACYLNHFET